MPITNPTIDDFQDTTVMRVIRKVVNYLVTLIPKVNEEIANVTDNAGQRLDSVEDNIEALNRELPTEIRVDYDPSTGNFNIDYVKEDGDVLTSNTVVIVSGSTGEVTIVQNTSGISINGTALQSATTAQPGLMTPALVASLNNVNDTVNDHTTMINGQATAISELDGRVDALEQAGGGSSGGSSGGSNFISIVGHQGGYTPVIYTTFLLTGVTTTTKNVYYKFRANAFNYIEASTINSGTSGEFVLNHQDAVITSSLYEDSTTLHTFTGANRAFVSKISEIIKINGDFTGTIEISAIPRQISMSTSTATEYDNVYYSGIGGPRIILNYIKSVLVSYNASEEPCASSGDSTIIPERNAVVTMSWYVDYIRCTGNFDIAIPPNTGGGD